MRPRQQLIADLRALDAPPIKGRLDAWYMKGVADLLEGNPHGQFDLAHQADIRSNLSWYTTREEHTEDFRELAAEALHYLEEDTGKPALCVHPPTLKGSK